MINRNILVGEEDKKLVCKISDFGLSEQLPVGQQECLTPPVDFAVKWSAVEILKGSPCSYKADVWLVVVVWDFVAFYSLSLCVALLFIYLFLF
jgi:hypothetical protein